MSLIRLIIASLLYHRRTNLAVALGVAAGTAVLSGALLVGDSMRGSLRHLVLDRLGKINRLLLTEQFFREELADEMKAVPAIILQVSMDNPSTKQPASASRVQLVGCDERFWKLGNGGPDKLPEDRQVVLNEPLAQRLGVKPGDWVIVRLPQTGSIPAESTLGKKDGTVTGFSLTVGSVIPARGLGRFAISSTQQLPLNAYVPLDWLQSRLDRPGRVNAMLATADSAPDGQLRPRLDDYGIRLLKTDRGYFDVSSQRMLLDPTAEGAILKALGQHQTQPVLTYLANTIACGEKEHSKEIPYSTITAIDFTKKPPLGPFLSTDGEPVGPLGDDQIALNAWAAEQLDAKVGDTIRVTYFDPASTHGRPDEQTVELRLAAVLQFEGAAADRNLTPRVPGITDELSMADWDPPFPFDPRRIRDDDEKYWDEFGPTPKAMVSLTTGRRLWGSRFGQTTSIRVEPEEGMTVESLAKQLDVDPAEMGFVLRPIKQQGLAAATGTTPFNVLFLSFSFFLIASAVMLVSLLFRLGIDRRAKQIGILVAVGIKHRQIVRLLAVEGLLVAAVGSLLGVAAGVGYAALMLAGLRTWWLGAVVTPFLHLYVTPVSLAVGWLSGLLVAFAAIRLSVRRVSRITPIRLLSGQTTDQRLLFTAPKALPRWMLLIEVAIAGLICVGVAGLSRIRLGEDVQAAVFFGVGALILALLIGRAWLALRRGAMGSAIRVGRGNLLRMAAGNAARNPGRSTLTIGLVASATFLIVAVSAFHLDPSRAVPGRDSGNGGFALVAQSDQPIYQDLNTAEGRQELGFDDSDSRLLEN
ncbi:MAG: FtsX-like permease family protein, partial [Thermoguttaceae bacterium]